MKIGQIVLKLRLANTIFENRIAGAAELSMALQGTLQKEVAFVLQLAEEAQTNKYDSGINQQITEKFGVIVALDNATSQKDKTGITAYDKLYKVRKELFSALLGWQIEEMEDLISYGGGKVLGINRAQLWYQFEFETSYRINDKDGVDDKREDLNDFDAIYAQWVMMPSEKIPAVRIPIDDPDMTSIIDFTQNPNEGSFGRGFGKIFEIYKK